MGHKRIRHMRTDVAACVPTPAAAARVIDRAPQVVQAHVGQPRGPHRFAEVNAHRPVTEPGSARCRERPWAIVHPHELPQDGERCGA